jgi:hypothetical protein
MIMQIIIITTTFIIARSLPLDRIYLVGGNQAPLLTGCSSRFSNEELPNGQLTFSREKQHIQEVCGFSIPILQDGLMSMEEAKEQSLYIHRRTD